MNKRCDFSPWEKLKQEEEKGRRAEERFFTIVTTLMLGSLDGALRGIVPASKSDDLAGFDFFLIVEIGGRLVLIPVQIKSSEGGVKYYRERHPHHEENGVLIMVVNREYSDDTLRRQVERKLKRIIDNTETRKGNFVQTLRRVRRQLVIIPESGSKESRIKRRVALEKAVWREYEHECTLSIDGGGG